MDGFAVSTEMVAAAGAAAGRVADAVRGLDVAAPVAALGAALPGGRAARVAGAAGPMWAAGVEALGGQARQHADALDAAAGAYRDADLSGAAGLPDNLVTGAGGPSRQPAITGSARPIRRSA